MNTRADLSGRALAGQVQDPEFKLQHHKGRKEGRKKGKNKHICADLSI
jgi:hypothetical protein